MNESVTDVELKVSVALATYNGAAYLLEQLLSIVEQSRQPDEIVICDDNSTDSTYLIVEQFAKSAEIEVRYVQNDHRLGYVKNFNRALSMSRGDIVFLSDQDDVWFSNKISTILSLQKLHAEKLLFINDAAIVGKDLTPTNLTKLGQLRGAGYADSAFVMGCCCAIRRDLLELALPIPEGATGHDNWLVGIANGLNATFITDEVLQLYRRHGSNESNVLANRLVPITKYDRLKRQLQRSTRGRSEQYATSEIGQRQMMLEGIGRGRGRLGGRYDQRLQECEFELRSELEFLHYRRGLRRAILPSRIIRCLAFWLSGGYSRASGLRSFIRDVIG